MSESKKPKTNRPTAGPLGVLPSGRTFAVESTAGEERLEIRSAGGNVEISIALTDAGPVVRVNGASLQIKSTDEISVQCKKLNLQTEEELSIRTSGKFNVLTDTEISMKSGGQSFFDADYVNLNCRDRTGYHDAGEAPEGSEG